ncbi:MAG: SPOR domain-containing protein [Thermoleophilaceae bacterium]
MPQTIERTDAPPAACPRCGADAEADQLFCLECGERLNLGYRRPPSWRLPAAVVGGVVLLAGAAAAFALVEISDEAEQVAGPPVQPPATSPQGTPTDETGTDEEEDEPPAPDEDGGSGDVREWPADTSAYTVILLSTDTVEGATATAEQAARAGIPAGVLDSSDYSSLNPGFQVVFAGEFDSSEEAQQEAERYAGLGFPGGYPRFVNGGE